MARQEPQSVAEILDHLVAVGRRNERVSIGDVMQALGSRSYGPFLLVPALIGLSPLGGIPGVPSLLAFITGLFSVQMLLGRKHLWVPQWLTRRSLPADRMADAARKIRPVGDYLDRWFHGRLTKLTKGLFVRIAAGICLALALTIPFLELIPFAATPPLAAIAMCGLALLVRDGVLMVVAGLVAGGAVVFGVSLLR